MNKFYTYQLEEYHGKSSRHKCPKCGDEHSFTLYVDEYGNYLDCNVGRCNHEIGCGYHYTPKQYFEDKGTYQRTTPVYNRVQNKKEAESPSYIDKDIVYKYQGTENNLICYLCNFFGYDALMKSCAFYFMGSTPDGSAIYWQIDTRMKVRSGKIIPYDKETGHRVKGTSNDVSWMHTTLKLKDYHLRQCLFGEHLLKRFPDKPVFLVESEKTAFICSCIMPDYNWLACGGYGNFKEDMLSVLAGIKRIVVFPDTDTDGKTYAGWKEKASKMKFANLYVSDYLEKKATEEQKMKKSDIADLMLECYEPKLGQISDDNVKVDEVITEHIKSPDTAFKMMSAKNPALVQLVNTFQCEIVN
jgi:hypothetical protein